MDTNTLREMFVYEDRGMLRRIVGGRKDYPWRKVGRGGKYLVITVGGETLYLHRLIWQYHHGRIPTNIDHINGGDWRDWPFPTLLLAWLFFEIIPALYQRAIHQSEASIKSAYIDDIYVGFWTNRTRGVYLAQSSRKLFENRGVQA